jgi:hypothetical protein
MSTARGFSSARPAQLHHADLAGYVELARPPPGQVARDCRPDQKRLAVTEGLVWFERAMVQQLHDPVDGCLHGPDGSYPEFAVERSMSGIVQARDHPGYPEGVTGYPGRNDVRAVVRREGDKCLRIA